MPNNPTDRTPDDQQVDIMPIDIRNDELTFAGQKETSLSFNSSMMVGVELESNWLCNAVILRFLGKVASSHHCPLRRYESSKYASDQARRPQAAFAHTGDMNRRSMQLG